MNNSAFLMSDSEVVNYMAYPRFLAELSLNETAKLIYVLLLNRARLSIKQGWADADGKIYILYTLKSLAKDSGKAERTAQKALLELEKAGLILRGDQIHGRSRKIYVKTVANFCTPGAQNIASLGRKILPTNKIEYNKKDRYTYEEGESL